MMRRDAAIVNEMEFRMSLVSKGIISTFAQRDDETILSE
jgi:hypothetical protein